MTTNNSNGGVGFIGVLVSMLTCLFIGLKLCGIINWSWWLVLSPLWIAMSLWLALVAMVLSVAFIVWRVKGSVERELKGNSGTQVRRWLDGVGGRRS